MSATVNWPAYQIGPRDSVFAIGVASSKFTELEQVLGFIFGIVFGIHDFDDELIVANVRSEAAAALVTAKLDKLTWPEELKGEAQHFITGFSICAENRNSLIHAVMEWRTGETDVFFKAAKTRSRSRDIAYARRVTRCRRFDARVLSVWPKLGELDQHIHQSAAGLIRRSFMA